jgi:hypothetical protein
VDITTEWQKRLNVKDTIIDCLKFYYFAHRIFQGELLLLLIWLINLNTRIMILPIIGYGDPVLRK